MSLLKELFKQKVDEAELDPKEEKSEQKIIGRAGDFVVELDEETEHVDIKENGESVLGMPYLIWKELKRQ